MHKSKATLNLTILRIIAAVAIVLFSFEITSSLFASDDFQIEIVDVNFDNDNETDDETNILDVIQLIISSDIIESKTDPIYCNLPRLSSQHLEKLPSPPPERG